MQMLAEELENREIRIQHYSKTPFEIKNKHITKISRPNNRLKILQKESIDKEFEK